MAASVRRDKGDGSKQDRQYAELVNKKLMAVHRAPELLYARTMRMSSQDGDHSRFVGRQLMGLLEGVKHITMLFTRNALLR